MGRDGGLEPALRNFCARMGDIRTHASARTENTMDSVILYFRSATLEAVAACANTMGELNEYGHLSAADGRGCWLHPYEDWAREYAPMDWLRVVERLKGSPASAFQLASQHGPNARFALEVAAKLMEACAPAVLDDNQGRLFTSEEVSAWAHRNEDAGIFDFGEN